MKYHEENRDLFSVSKEYCLCHCISRDFMLGAGIARQFVKRYDMRFKLCNIYGNGYSGNSALCVNGVYNLLTKDKYYEKPTYESLKEALEDMKNQMIQVGQRKLAMPRIGCGLDGLDWNRVRDVVKSVFKNTNVEILVCVWED